MCGYVSVGAFSSELQFSPTTCAGGWDEMHALDLHLETMEVSLKSWIGAGVPSFEPISAQDSS